MLRSPAFAAMTQTAPSISSSLALPPYICFYGGRKWSVEINGNCVCADRKCLTDDVAWCVALLTVQLERVRILESLRQYRFSVLAVYKQQQQQKMLKEEFVVCCYSWNDALVCGAAVVSLVSAPVGQLQMITITSMKH